MAWSYDANGNVASITDHTSAGRQTRSMTYDNRDRLLTVASPLYPGGATYAYDVLDNLTRVTVAGRDHRYVYDASNRLGNVTDGPGGPSVIGLGYDVRGNVVNRNGQLYQFDYGNRLRTALASQTYRYDAQGRRTRTVSGSANLYEVYGQQGQMLFQRDDALGNNYNYVYLNGTVVAVRVYPVAGGADTQIYWHTDALGSQIAATVGTSVVQTTEHEPYGKQLNRVNNNRMGYAGHVMDAATSLVYMQQRYYDPQIGRFLSVDPVTAYAKPGTNFNRYWYGNNNPYRFTDPDGRYSCDGSKGDCAKVDQYVKKVGEASRSRDLKPSERAQVRAVSNYLGKKGEGGPKITPTALPKNTKASTDQRGNIKIDVKKNPAGADAIVHGAMALGHEAQHDVDAKANGEAHTRDVATQRDQNAYGTEALIGKANGVFLSPATIESAVKGSIENAFGPEPEKPNEP